MTIVCPLESTATMRRYFVLIALLFITVTGPFISFAQTANQTTLPPDAEAAIKKGILAAQQQGYLLAIRYFQDARKLEPQAPEVFYDLGLAESKIPGRELRAMAWFDAYLAANPDAANAAAVNEEIERLDVKGQINVSRVIKPAQDAASQPAFQRDAGNNQQYAFAWVARLWAETGDLTAALNTVDLIQDAASKSMAYVKIVDGQATAGDIAGAKKTADQIQYARDRSWAQREIAEAQAKASDIIGAQETLSHALKTADLIQDAYWKSSEQKQIAEAQAKIGSTTERVSTVRPITVAQAPILPTVSVPVQPTVPVIEVSDWINKLEYHNWSLNSDPFLGLASYLKSLPPSDNPETVYLGLRETAEILIKAQIDIERMLKQQAKQ